MNHWQQPTGKLVVRMAKPIVAPPSLRLHHTWCYFGFEGKGFGEGEKN
jgi:hypothetical protein